MSNSAGFMENLLQLFSECDRNKSGSLGLDEFKELCSKIGLSVEMADETFKRLDVDKNCQITFDEFASGFNKYKQQQQLTARPPPTQSANGEPGQQQPAGKSQGVGPSGQQLQQKLAPSPVTTRARSRASPSNQPGALSLGSTGGVSSSCSSNLTMSQRSTSSGGGGGQFDLSAQSLASSTDCGPDFAPIEQQQQQQQQRANDVLVYSSDLINSDSVEQLNGSGQFGSIMSSSSSYNQLKSMSDLMECVQKLQNENQILTQIFFKDKREREEYISQLGEEFDNQLREVEERANRRAREELENEKKRLCEMMQAERETLQQHYKTLEKISKLVKGPPNGRGQEDADGFTSKVKSQLEDTFLENRQLKKSLHDTKTDVALIWKEMEKIKKQYEDKLSNAYEKQRKTQHECDHIKLQLNLMKDSNRKLQDASDVITNYITDKVEPVIKVAMDNADDDSKEPGAQSNAHFRLINNDSTSSSRRGSILSNYLNNSNNNDASGGGKHSGKVDGESCKSGSSANVVCESDPYGSLANVADAAASSSKLLQRMNGLETSLIRNNRFHQSTTSSSTTNSDNNSPSPPPNAKAVTEKQKQCVVGIGQEEQDAVKKDESCLTNKERKSEQLTQTPISRASQFKNLGRNILLSARTNSEAQSKQQTANIGLVEAKSQSADRAEEPVVEPADGLSVATFNIILVGDSFVGKSSFAARFIEGNFVQGLISNCSIDFKTKAYKVNGVNYTVNLWDTAGQERFRSITASYFRKADGIILMYDVTDKRSYLNVRNWMSTISDTAAENVAVLLVGNKIDLRVNDNKANCVPTEEGFRLASEYGIVFLETSVKIGTNLLPSMGRLIRLIAKNNTVEDEDTDRIRLSDKGRTFNCMPKNC